MTDDNLKEMKEWVDEGLITEGEYQEQKKAVLASSNSSGVGSTLFRVLVNLISFNFPT